MKRVAEFKKKYEVLLKDIMPEDEREAFTQHNVVNVLTERDHKGRRVLIVNCGGKYKKNLCQYNFSMITQVFPNHFVLLTEKYFNQQQNMFIELRPHMFK